MAESTVEAAGNGLLARLPPEEVERLLPHLRRVSFRLGEVIYESGGRQSYIYFPTTAIISLLYLMENGSSAEMGVAGREGLVGVALFMGGETVPNRAVVQSAGAAFRMRTKVLQDEFARGGAFQRLLLRYTQALMTQMSQTAVCNRLHTIEQQLCRWLLLSHDRLDSDELVMTQELIANMLGVRREGVSKAASLLQKDGLINYSRGRIKILDRAGLGRSPASVTVSSRTKATTIWVGDEFNQEPFNLGSSVAFHLQHYCSKGTQLTGLCAHQFSTT
ncbi:MAG TPA: Crp/Fnr family transcriptional regulator [Pyrinomonadaceae bacterium]|nr:Crp/Fnr family transcriptional regulator [Pyrinomonadaceae bacterium]